jgi:hypothetical protein
MDSGENWKGRIFSGVCCLVRVHAGVARVIPHLAECSMWRSVPIQPWKLGKRSTTLNRRKFKAKMIRVNREIQMRRRMLKFKDDVPC